MIHYILVRKDLPFGVTLAQVGHAAGESMGKWAEHLKDRSVHYPPTSIVVLGVPNLRSLRYWEKKLWGLVNSQANIYFTSIHEPDAPYNGELMAIGIWPGEKDKLGPIFKRLKTYRKLND